MTLTEELAARLHLIWDEDKHGWLSPTHDHWQTCPFRVLVAFAVDTARPIIETDAATDEDLTDLLPVAQAALRAPATRRLADSEIDALARVAALGAEYLENNRYAEDEEYPEEAAMARAIGSMREEAFRFALERHFDRRWQDGDDRRWGL